MRHYWLSGLLCVVMLFALSAWNQGRAPFNAGDLVAELTDTPTAVRVVRVGVIPVIDVLPFYVADQQGYFTQQGIQVEFVPAKAAQERDALMQAGEIDAMLTDLVAVGLFNREQVQLQVVATARRATVGSPMFRVLAAPGAEIKIVKDVAGVPVGISRNTIIQYVTERLLVAEGLTPEQIKTTEVSAIPVRFEQLINGQLKVATLPDPLGQGALAAGASLLVDDSRYTQYAQTVLCFSRGAVESWPDTIKGFLTAWDLAVRDLNDHPDQFADLLIEKGRVPDSIKGTYRMPVFASGEVPRQAEWQDVMDWMVEKGLLEQSLVYTDSVLSNFVE